MTCKCIEKGLYDKEFAPTITSHLKRPLCFPCKPN